MSEVAIRLPKEKIIEGLYQLSFKEIRELINLLIQKKLYQPPNAKAIYKETALIIKKRKLSEKIAEQAIKWARRQK